MVDNKKKEVMPQKDTKKDESLEMIKKQSYFYMNEKKVFEKKRKKMSCAMLHFLFILYVAVL